MIDLSEIPTELLQQELDKRKKEERELRKSWLTTKYVAKTAHIESMAKPNSIHPYTTKRGFA